MFALGTSRCCHSNFRCKQFVY